MTLPPNLEHMGLRCRLAQLIDEALQRGQRVTTAAPEKWKRWTNAAFAKKVDVTESAVRSWRHHENPVRPTHIVKMLDVFYGDIETAAPALRPIVESCRPARKAMYDAWRLADGYAPVEPEAPRSSTIQSTDFGDLAEIVVLQVHQPTPDNYPGNLIIPVTLGIRPDEDFEYAGKKVEIGVKEAYFAVESKDWQPGQNSIFGTRKTPKVGETVSPGVVQVFGKTDAKGRIHDTPLDDAPNVTMEPQKDDADGPIAFSVRVKRDSFVVTTRGGAGTTDAQNTDAQNTVLDAVFADGAFPKDRKGRLIVARKTVKPRVTRDPVEDPA